MAQISNTSDARLIAQSAAVFRLGDLALDANSRFYNFILTFLVASAGLTSVYDSKNYAAFMNDVDGVFPGELGAKVDLGECIRRVRAGALPQEQAEIALCSMLANVTYESISDGERDRLKGDATYEFYRHVRNAASHGNRWHFYPNQPTFRGQWRSFVIDESLKGVANPIHNKKCIYGSIKPADLLWLLADIEKLL